MRSWTLEHKSPKSTRTNAQWFKLKQIAGNKLKFVTSYSLVEDTHIIYIYEFCLEFKHNQISKIYIDILRYSFFITFLVAYLRHLKPLYNRHKSTDSHTDTHTPSYPHTHPHSQISPAFIAAFFGH